MKHRNYQNTLKAITRINSIPHLIN